MPLLYTRNWHVTVRWPGRQGDLLVETSFADTSCERSSLLRVAPDTLEIRHAQWQEHRSQTGRPDPEVHVPERLVGVVAYFNCGKEINAALPDDPGGDVGDLFKEAVKVLIQAEPLFLRQRGFPDVERYVEHLLPTFVYGGCFFGSHAERTPYIARDKFLFHHRKEDLFTRYRFLSVQEDDGQYGITGTICDSYHEMQMRLRVGRTDGIIARAEADLIRGPEQVCPGATAVFGRLVGMSLTPAGKRDLLKAVGSGDGCSHLADLVGEAVKAVCSPWIQGRAGRAWPPRGGMAGREPL
ncbi:MAG: DUF2889 domain-containing protein [Deltaproteobacteria bacterium]|nr:DUF2889 domain-containing protein [Deltaproteobacteria bacterium]